MDNRHVRNVRRVWAAALLASTLAFSVAACGGDGEGEAKAPAASSSTAKDEGENAPEGETLPDRSKTLATLKNDEGIEMIVYSATRDSGGFLTISGDFKNPGGESFTTPVVWSGQEEAVAGAGPSLAAMTLVDSVGKKRYYVLRDTDNRPLTTSNYASSIESGESLNFFAQFPAPPNSSTKVDLQFPGFPNATIEIS
ncbi:hypothetical protein GA0115239_102348 [Streptomyces sp. BpilaLS-43]|uniref:hypothetical protein n=1 Tax=Streptomyces sp. BpilaLS-43 TaxID=1839778 RepID=UPI00081B353A|nr:hypothetical protein [Streptomyces sp. BpilaLS-43]SCD48061.1 hypothetical protein GA0115239_102348 [Streptomyces sp. BpilaLS-43]